MQTFRTIKESESMARGRVRALIGVGAAAGVAAVGLFAATPAFAGTDVSVGTTGGSGEFVSYGDHFRLSDETQDGYSVKLCYKVNSGSVHTLWNRSGYGSTVDWNMDFPEGAKVTIDVVRNYPGNVCKPWAVGYA
jgi:hypothetical protein